MRKVDTKENLADALTKHVTAEELNFHIASTGQIIVHGRHELAPDSGDINYIEDYIDEEPNQQNYHIDQFGGVSNYPCCARCKSTCLCTGRCAIKSFVHSTSGAIMAKEECRISESCCGQYGTHHYSLHQFDLPPLQDALPWPAWLKHHYSC